MKIIIKLVKDKIMSWVILYRNIKKWKIVLKNDKDDDYKSIYFVLAFKLDNMKEYLESTNDPTVAKSIQQLSEASELALTLGVDRVNDINEDKKHNTRLFYLMSKYITFWSK